MRFMSRKRHPIARFAERSAQVAELVDAYVSGAYVARRAGSSPVLGTEFFVKLYIMCTLCGVQRQPKGCFLKKENNRNRLR